MTVKFIQIGLVSFFLTSAIITLAQSDTGNPLNGLDALKDFQALRVSSADPNWRTGNGDSRPIPPGKTLVLADIKEGRGGLFISGTRLPTKSLTIRAC